MASVLHSKNRVVSRANNPKTVTYIRVGKAVYAGDCKVRITFTDATEQLVDFEPFLLQNSHPQHNKYLDRESFKTFSIDMGNLVWGSDWDLIFPVEQLHKGHISW